MSVRMYSNPLPLFACSTLDALGASGEESAGDRVLGRPGAAQPGAAQRSPVHPTL